MSGGVFDGVIPDETLPEQPNVLHALVRKRAEIAGKIEHTQRNLRGLIADLDNVESTIRIFQPDAKVEAIRPKPYPPRHAAFKGEVTRIVLKTLKKVTEAGGSVTSREIALTLMSERGLNPDDRELLIVMTKRVCACLRVQRQKGLATTVPTTGDLQGWRLVPLEERRAVS